MEKEKKYLQYSLLGLCTFPFVFIVVCGLLCIKIPTLYPYIDILLILFVGFVLVFLGSSYYFYRKLGFPIFVKDQQAVVHESEDVHHPFMNTIRVDSQFHGNITSDEDIVIEGILKGTITTKGTLYICGSLEGNAKCKNLELKKGNIVGNVTCTSQALIEKDSCISGNLKAGEGILSGSVTGSVSIKGNLELTSTAVVGKNVLCAKVKKAKEAEVKGKIKKS